MDSQGLEIAGNCNLLRTPEAWKEFEDKTQAGGWPPDDLLPLLALGQHYGVATRLLDWSDKPLVAAYFAAWKDSKPSRRMIGIWALNLDWVINQGFRGSGQEFEVFVVTAPRASNPNLHAQGGIFTTEKLNAAELKGPLSNRTVNRIVLDRWNGPGRFDRRRSVMIHLTLPGKEVKKLVRLLHAEGVDASAVFPGYKGAADSVKERAFWDRRECPSYWW